MSHVTSGRHNMADNTILVMRHLGMRAYQTPLFPALTAPEIKRLNYLDLPSLSREKLHRVLCIFAQKCAIVTGQAYKLFNYALSCG
jgi:hypothetical protein